MAGPEHHEVLLENDQVRVLNTRISPREGTTLWTAALGPHSAKNVGTQELRVIAVELKNAF